MELSAGMNISLIFACKGEIFLLGFFVENVVERDGIVGKEEEKEMVVDVGVILQIRDEAIVGYSVSSLFFYTS